MPTSKKILTKINPELRLNWPLDGGPLIPPGPTLEPRGPLGAPRLRDCMGGGPRLPPLSNRGFVACSTLIVLPSRDCKTEVTITIPASNTCADKYGCSKWGLTLPFISRAASFASLGLSNVTKAKPLDLFVSRSFIRITEKVNRGRGEFSPRLVVLPSEKQVYKLKMFLLQF